MKTALATLAHRVMAAAFPAVAAFLVPAGASAHPHVFAEANLEIVRNEAGEATEIRHVWRFDEFFSATVVLDFDANGNGELDRSELGEVARIVNESLADFNFYTEVRQGEAVIDFYEPDPFLVDFQNGQIIMILAMQLVSPQMMGPEGFRVAVSDPTYYVAIDFLDIAAVQVSGNSGNCTSQIVVPDWDALYAQDAQRLADLFAAGPDEEVEASEDYLTWVEFSCTT